MFSFSPWFNLSFVEPSEMPPNFMFELLESYDFWSSKEFLSNVVVLLFKF